MVQSFLAYAHFNKVEIMFSEYPEITPEDWTKASEQARYIKIAFEVYKSLGINIVTLISLEEKSEKFKSLSSSLEFKIIKGHLLKVASLSKSILYLTSENKFSETISLIQRVQFETIINARYLIVKNDPAVFKSYVKSSLSPEKELWIRIQDNIAKREGRELAIEVSMLRSIAKFCRLGNVSIEELNPKFSAWSPNFYEKCKMFGLEDNVAGIYGIGSHGIHSSFVDIMYNYLQENENGIIEAKYSHNAPEENHLTMTGVFITQLCSDFASYAFTDSTATLIQDYFDWYRNMFVKINIEIIRSRHGS